MKRYLWRGGTYQFEEDEAPQDAVLIEKEAKAANKEQKPVNKKAKTSKK